MGFVPSCEQVQNGIIVVDGKRWHPKTRACDCIQYGSVITFTPTFCHFSSEDVPKEYQQNNIFSNSENKPNIHSIRVNITSSDYQVDYEVNELEGHESKIIMDMRSYFSVRFINTKAKG